MYVPEDLPPPPTERLRLIRDANLGLLALAERLRQHWAAHAAASGLSPVQVRVLLTLRPGHAAPMRDLAAALDYDASNLSTLVDRLERRGTVRRQPDPADRRVKALALTAEGERLRASFWQGLTGDPGPLAALSDEHLRALAQILTQLDPAPSQALSPTPSSRQRRGYLPAGSARTGRVHDGGVDLPVPVPASRSAGKWAFRLASSSRSAPSAAPMCRPAAARDQDSTASCPYHRPPSSPAKHRRPAHSPATPARGGRAGRHPRRRLTFMCVPRRPAAYRDRAPAHTLKSLVSSPWLLDAAGGAPSNAPLTT